MEWNLDEEGKRQGRVRVFRRNESSLKPRISTLYHKETQSFPMYVGDIILLNVAVIGIVCFCPWIT